MKKLIPLLLIIIAAIFLFQWNRPESHAEASEPASMDELPPMEKAAHDFLASLDEDQLNEALIPFEGDKRFDWHFVPLETRIGVMIRHLNEKQRTLVTQLLKTTLSEEGHRKVRGIMQLEQALREVEGRDLQNDTHRDPEKYYLAIFGKPDIGEPWGWRYEGHHISLNFSSVTGKTVVTPAFMGSNPAQVRSGVFEGTEILKDEQAAGRALVKMLSSDQQEKAIISPDAPHDIITGTDRQARLESFEGIVFSDLNENQQKALTSLIAIYLNNMKEEIANEQMAKITEAGLDKIYFAWAGGIEPGDAHYYRIHGPGFVIEYDNIQNNANHIHTTWRDFEGDFGEDLLKKHYETHPHHKH